jgi:hypothetical protein
MKTYRQPRRWGLNALIALWRPICFGKLLREGSRYGDYLTYCSNSNYLAPLGILTVEHSPSDRRKLVDPLTKRVGSSTGPHGAKFPIDSQPERPGSRDRSDVGRIHGLLTQSFASPWSANLSTA